MDVRGHGRGIRTTRFTLEGCADAVAALIETMPQLVRAVAEVSRQVSQRQAAAVNVLHLADARAGGGHRGPARGQLSA